MGPVFAQNFCLHLLVDSTHLQQENVNLSKYYLCSLGNNNSNKQEVCVIWHKRNALVKRSLWSQLRWIHQCAIHSLQMLPWARSPFAGGRTIPLTYLIYLEDILMCQYHTDGIIKVLRLKKFLFLLWLARAKVSMAGGPTCTLQRSSSSLRLEFSCSHFSGLQAPGSSLWHSASARRWLRFCSSSLFWEFFWLSSVFSESNCWFLIFKSET